MHMEELTHLAAPSLRRRRLILNPARSARFPAVLVCIAVIFLLNVSPALAAPQSVSPRQPSASHSQPRKVAAKAHPTLKSSCCGGGADNVTNWQGFDACSVAAASTSEMQSWWNNSWYSWIGIYIGGPNHPAQCPIPSTSWLTAVQSQGWQLLPLYDGLASPCLNDNSSAPMSQDPTTAYNQGVSDANEAMQDANNLGLAGTIIYEDMEPFDPSSCSYNAAVSAYTSGWSQTLAQSTGGNGGFVPGMYTGHADVAVVVAASWVPTDIDITQGGCWAGGQSNSCTVWNIADVPNGWFINDQRVYQYANNFYECHSGCLLIDADAANGLVFGPGGGDADTSEGSNESISSDP